MKTLEEINWEDEYIEKTDFGGVTKLFWENPEWFYNEMRDLGWKAGVPHGVTKYVDKNGEDVTEEMTVIMGIGKNMHGMLHSGNLYSVFTNLYRRLACGEYKAEFEAWKKQRADEERANGNEYPYPYIGWQDWCKRDCYKEWGSTRFGQDTSQLEERDFNGSLYRSNIDKFAEYRDALREAAEKYDLSDDFPGLEMARFDTWQEYLAR